MKTTLIAASLVALAVLAPHQAAAADCKLNLIATLPMVQDQDGGVRVPATLGTKQTVMLVDTGGVYSMVGQHIVDTLKPEVVPIDGAGFRMINGHELKLIAHIRPFALGEMTTHEYLFLVMPDGVVAPKDLDGTIAPDILANFDIDLDFAGKKMNLFSQDHCPGKVVYWTKDWAEVPFKSPDNLHIVVSITLDGKDMDAELDTGSSQSFMSAYTARRMFDVTASDPVSGSPSTGDTGDGPSKSFNHTFASLSTNGVTITNPHVVVLPDDRSSLIGHVGKMLLGMTELRRFRIYIAYREHVLYVTPADAH